MKHAVLGILAASILGAAASPALAAASGAGGFGAVTFTLIDLNPGDGIAPSITFAPTDFPFAGGYLHGEVRAVMPNEEAFREYERYGLTQLSSISGSTATPMSNSQTSLTGAANVGFSSMSASGNALSGVNATGTFYSVASAPLANFTLSANTAVSFSVSGWARGETTIGLDRNSGWDEWGGALLELSASGLSADGQDIVWDRLEEGARASYVLDEFGNASGYSDSWQGNMTVGYSNWSSVSAEGAFSAQVSAAGHSVSAVPEPETYGMLLAGLGVIGSLARRRRNAEAENA